jgi:[acyl-carrier-protein] S-malonyltransferase
MLDTIAGNAAAEAVLDEGARTLGEHVREWLAQPATIDANATAQPLLCLAELATWAALRDSIDPPLAFAGYSIGELASYACAGALDAGALARIARTRAALMDHAGSEPGGLVAVRGLLRAEVQALCRDHAAYVAIAMAEDAFVLGGLAPALDAVADHAKERGAQITCLKVGVAAHTPLVSAAEDGFRLALEASSLRAPRVPVVAGIDASWITTREKAIATLSAQIATTIEWGRVLQTLRERGARVFLELGPGSALSRMVREQLPDAQARSVSEFRTIDGVVAWLRRAIV